MLIELDRDNFKSLLWYVISRGETLFNMMKSINKEIDNIKESDATASDYIDGISLLTEAMAIGKEFKSNNDNISILKDKLDDGDYLFETDDYDTLIEEMKATLAHNEELEHYEDCAKLSVLIESIENGKLKN